MTVDDLDVLKVLQTAVIAAVAASTTPVLPIKVVGRIFVPQTDTPTGKWLEVIWLPNNDVTATWGDEVRYMGTVRLILHWPNDNEGAYPPLAALASICTPFAKDELLGAPGKRLQIYAPPTTMTPQETPTETLYPATMRYVSCR